MSDFDFVVRSIGSVLSRTVELERRIAGSEFKGRVSDVDAEKKTLRLVIGKSPEGEDVLSPRIPIAQIAGDLKVHDLPSVGQQGVIRTANGDIEQGSFSTLHWSEGFESISDDADDKKLTFGDVTIDLTSNAFKIQIGSSVLEITPSGILLNGSKVAVTGASHTHNSVNIGDTHVHSGVIAGGDDTEKPH